jgi:hypothetical protein
MRPVLPGREGWVRTAINWHSISYAGGHRIDGDLSLQTVVQVDGMSVDVEHAMFFGEPVHPHRLLGWGGRADDAPGSVGPPASEIGVQGADGTQHPDSRRPGRPVLHRLLPAPGPAARRRAIGLSLALLVAAAITAWLATTWLQGSPGRSSGQPPRSLRSCRSWVATTTAAGVRSRASVSSSTRAIDR